MILTMTIKIMAILKTIMVAMVIRMTNHVEHNVIQSMFAFAFSHH